VGQFNLLLPKVVEPLVPLVLLKGNLNVVSSFLFIFLVIDVSIGFDFGFYLRLRILLEVADSFLSIELEFFELV